MTLKAPFPYFGGKSLIAETVWSAFGHDLRNYLEPFAGSLAVLLARPGPVKGPETVNDWSCQLVNAWRAIQQQPEATAALCVAPVAEVNTEAQHAALMRRADDLRTALGDPHYCDPEAAAWWIKGCNEWIGGGWCGGDGPWHWSPEDGWHLGDTGKGVNRKLPHLGDAGTGVNRQLPHLGDAGKGHYAARVAAITAWFTALQDRLCSVRITCGDWQRVVDSQSTTVKHGLTGIFLDPPYDETEYVYGRGGSISARVREWCQANGDNPLLRIILCGRAAEHDVLLSHGWTRSAWTTRKGYAHAGNDTEALWISPHCVNATSAADTLFDLDCM